MNDEQMIARFERRDESVLADLQEAYGAYAMSIAQRICADTQTAEECVNDALQSAWSSIPPAPKNLKLYFAALVRNSAINRLRRAHAQKRGGKAYDAVYEELSQCIAGDRDSPEKIAMEKELSLAINRFLKALPERDRSIFLRRYFFMESAECIAQSFAMRRSNVLLILSRTRKKLRQFLETEEYLE